MFLLCLPRRPSGTMRPSRGWMAPWVERRTASLPPIRVGRTRSTPRICTRRAASANRPFQACLARAPEPGPSIGDSASSRKTSTLSPYPMAVFEQPSSTVGYVFQSLLASDFPASMVLAYINTRTHTHTHSLSLSLSLSLQSYFFPVLLTCLTHEAVCFEKQSQDAGTSGQGRGYFRISARRHLRHATRCSAQH